MTLFWKETPAGVGPAPIPLGGDFDGDGLGDVIVGEAEEVHHGTLLGPGVAWVLWGTGAPYLPALDDEPEPSGMARQAERGACGCQPEGPAPSWVALLGLALLRRRRLGARAVSCARRG